MMRNGICGALAVAFVGCFSPTSEGPTPDGGRCVTLAGVAGERVCVATLPPVVCGGQRCVSAQVCCQTTGACVSDTSACPKPPTNDLNGRPACGSNADCRAEEYCAPDDFRLDSSGPQPARCIGLAAHCQPMSHCKSCVGPDCQVCGCDGVTYESPQVACVSGVVALSFGACGSSIGFDGGAFSVLCGTTDQCPSGAECCFRTGRCYEASEAWRCQTQDSGAVLNCDSSAECNAPNGAGGGNGGSGRLCLGAGPGCGGPGLCSTAWPSSSCGGEVNSVCGCDGTTYVNECWARSAGSRVAHGGSCP